MYILINMEKLYTIPEAADLLRISRAKLYILIKKGTIRPIKIDGRVVFTDKELSNFIARLEEESQKGL